VAYDVLIPDEVRAYLNNLPLSPTGKDLVTNLINQRIANTIDRFRLDPANRPDPNKPCFVVRHLFADFSGDGYFHTIDIYVSDRWAEQGVLVIAYIEYHRGGPIWPESSPSDLD
jgi:hypothetical protein